MPIKSPLSALVQNLEPEFAGQFQKEDKARRTFFVFGFTTAFSIAAAVIVLLGFQGHVAEIAVEGFLNLVQLMIIFYLSTSTIDRSEVLTNIGRGVRARGENATNVTVMTPDQVRQFGITVNNNPVVPGTNDDDSDGGSSGSVG